MVLCGKLIFRVFEDLDKTAAIRDVLSREPGAGND